MPTKKQIEQEQFAAELASAVQVRDVATAMNLIDPAKYKGAKIHRSRFLNHWKRVAALLGGTSNDTKGGSAEFQRQFAMLCRRFILMLDHVDSLKGCLTTVREQLRTVRELNDVFRRRIAEDRECIDRQTKMLGTLAPFQKAIRDIGDAVVQSGWADSSEEVGSVSERVIELLWKHKTTLEQLGDMREKYENACKTIAKMHAAAMGKVVGPTYGVVEDVSAMKLSAETAIKVLGKKLGYSEVRIDADGNVFGGYPASTPGGLQ